MACGFAVGETWFLKPVRNKRALEVPLSRESALYAVDDLHRIEAGLHGCLSICPSLPWVCEAFFALPCVVSIFQHALDGKTLLQAIVGTKLPPSGSYATALQKLCHAALAVHCLCVDAAPDIWSLN